MKALLLRTTAVTLMLVLLGSAPAQAHDRTVSTSITLNANKTVIDAGEKVKFRGRLTSPWKRCRRWQPVTLYRDGNAVGAKKTMKNGKFQFSKNVQRTSNWRVKFNGKRWGKHPHDHRCLGSTSVTVRVRVRSGGGGGGGNNDVLGAGGGGGGVLGAGGGAEAGVTEVLGAGGGSSALTGSDIFPALSAMIALGVLGLVGLIVGLRRTRAPTSSS